MELVLSFADTVTQAFPYALALSPLVVGVIALVNSLFKKLTEDPIVGPIVNTTLVVLESTKAVWKPMLSGALAIIKPIVRALVLLVKSARDLILSVKASVLSALVWVKTNGGEASYYASEFVKAMYRIVKTLGKGLYYLSKGLGICIASFEQTREFLGILFTNPSAITWNFFQENAFSLALTSSLVGLLVWTLLERRKARQEEKAWKSSISRRRAFLYSEDGMKEE